MLSFFAHLPIHPAEYDYESGIFVCTEAHVAGFQGLVTFIKLFALAHFTCGACRTEAVEERS